MRWFDRALPLVNQIAASQRLRNLVNYRDKNLAHALSESIAESRGDVFQPPKYGFERKLLRVSVSITDRLYLGICNTGFAWDGSRSIARGNAEALWKACRFEIDS